MKRILLVLAIVAFAAGGLWAQITYEEFQTSFQDFADGVANSLPVTASVGLNWSPAYIGQFPHFGVGVSLGGMVLPYETMKPVVDALNISGSIPDQLKTYGLPFPSVSADARLGGFLLPFDFGLKFGTIPDSAKELFSQNVTVEYLLIGGDVRVPLVKGRGLVPTLSVGGGYTFLEGAIGVADVIAGTEPVDIGAIMIPLVGGSTHLLEVTDPDLAFTWDSHVFQGKVQASWNAFLFTPHVGLGAAYGVSNAGGGLLSQVVYNNDAGATLSDVEDAFTDLGYTVPTADGIEVSSAANGYSFWVYGGTAINIFFIKVDLSAMYNIVNKDYGASVNVRLQL